MRPFVLASTLLAAAIAPVAAAGLSVWIGPSTGNWSNAGNWSNGVPNDLAMIDGAPRSPFAVTQNINASLSILTIGAGDSLTSLDNIDTTLTGLVNNGTWFVNSGGNPCDLMMNAALTTFSGTGSVQLGNNPQNRMFGVGALRTLANGAGHTIRGSGQIGLNNNLNLVNDGVIRADQPNALVLDLSPSCLNNGLLTASGGGTLVLLNTAFDNTNGVIRAEADGVVSLQGAGIVGGEIETQDNGVINLTTNISSFDAVHITGVLTQPDNADVYLNSSITNDGVWNSVSAGNPTDINVNAASVAFDGVGVLAMSNNTQNRIFGAGALRTLVNGANHTIHGSGQIGSNNNLNLVNDGVIRADQTNALTVDLTNSCTNNGLLVASGNGTLVLLNSAFDNTNGIIRGEPGGVVSLQGAGIVNGELETTGSGIISLTTNISSFDAVHITGMLTQPDNADVYLNSSVTNDGLWNSLSAGNLTDIYVNADSVALNGSGVLAMSDNSQNRIYGVGALRTLVNGLNHTIHGSGQIGLNNNLNLVNNGVIRADQTNALTLDLTNSCTNNGLLAASGGGTLILLNSAFDNTNAVIRAEDGGAISLQGADIINGDLETQGSGIISLTTNISSLNAVHIVGTLTQPDNADVYLYSSITNDGVWKSLSVGNLTDIYVNAPAVTLNGNGVLTMSNNAQNRIYGVGALRTLVNSATHTIRGAGQIGLNNNLNLVNHGVIRADQPIGLTLDLTNSCTNDGLLAASDGGTLVLLNSTIDSTDGVIRAEDASAVSLQGAALLNGNLETQGTGSFYLTTSASSLDAVHITGLVTQPDNADVYLNSSITNDGTWNSASVGNLTDTYVNAPTVTLNGNGVLSMSNNAQNRIYGVGALRTLVNSATHTIKGSGQIGLNNNLDFTNHGTVIADSSSGLSIDCTSLLTNDGTLHVTDTGGLAIQASGFDQSGIVEVDAGRTLTRVGPWTQNAGTTIANGSINLTSSGTFQLNDGIFTGSGTASGAMFNSGGIVKPGPTDGSTIGTLHVTGAFTQGTEGIFDVEAGLAGNDLLAVSGAASIAGKLVVRFTDGFVPAIGQSFTILTASSVSGIFSCVSSDPLPAGALLVTYLPTSVKVSIVAGSTNPADLSGDGIVNSLDLALLLGGWGENCTTVCCPGDINGDGVVNAMDLGILLGAWGG